MPLSEDSHKARRRACDICHKRKIQCDSVAFGVSCSSCSRMSEQCTFNRVFGKQKGRPRKNKAAELSKRIREVEEALAKAIARQEAARRPPNSPVPATNPAFPAQTKRQSANPFSLQGTRALPLRPVITASSGSNSQSPFSKTMSYGQIYHGGLHIGTINSSGGGLLLSPYGQQWVSERTGKEISDSHLMFKQRVFAPQLSIQLVKHTNNDYELPDARLVRQCLDDFLMSTLRHLFPILDCVLFEQVITLAYESGNRSLSLPYISAKACIFAFVSLMYLFKSQEKNTPNMTSDSFAAKAHCFLLDALEEPTIVSLQTVVMMQIQQTFSGRLQMASALHATACRIVFALGGHLYQPVATCLSNLTLAERETQQIRMLFWLCYIFDKDIALRTAQPPSISDEYCDLTLPNNSMFDSIAQLDPEETCCSGSKLSEDLTLYLPADIRLSFLKDRTARLLYSIQPQKSDAEILRDIRELDDNLESWRLSIPIKFRPALSISDEAQVLIQNMPPDERIRYIILHLEYHHLISTIHRASERCLIPSNEIDVIKHNQTSGIQSSIALSLEASRSTLIFLRAAVYGMGGEAFWVLIFYPTAAIIVLFLNILRHPSSPQARKDLDLLSISRNFIKYIPIARPGPYEISYIDLMDDLVSELIQLAYSTMSKFRILQAESDTLG